MLRWRDKQWSEIEFVVRGASAGSGEELRRRVRGWARSPALNVVVRPSTATGERLTADLLRASLVLMPWRAGGFGLFGVEAIEAGTPVLVSSASGLGILIERTLELDDAQRIVVPMEDDDDRLTERWARMIGVVLHDRNAAFRRAAASRADLASRITWAAAARSVLSAVS